MKDYITNRIALLTEGVESLDSGIKKGDAQLAQMRLNLIATRAALQEAEEMLKEITKDAPVAPVVAMPATDGPKET
jgi:hypothetical protein